MKAWLITVGEPLPTDEGRNRLLRTGLLASTLARRGHEVTWWTSTFDHWRKIHRFDRDTVLSAGNGLRLVLLRGIGYRKNVSLRRMGDHAWIAWRFLRLAHKEPRPDVILCSLPTVELCLAAVRYGARSAVPVLIDVRDLWPDIFLGVAPPRWRPLARLALAPLFRAARRACRAASGIIGNSPGYVAWGLRNAGREAGVWDRDFPFGYSQDKPDDENLAKAGRFWNGHGIADRREDCFVLCFFGTLSHQFDLATVIAAARRLARGPRKFKFVLCGTGGALDEFKAIAADCPHVVFPGWVGQPEIWTLMRRSHAGLAPYHDSDIHRYNLPNKPIEYMSAGLPTVSSLSGYLREVLAAHDCGVTYRDCDADSLASALAALYDDRGRLQTMSQNAAALYESRFVAQRVYGDMAAHLEQAAASAGARRPPASST